MKLQRVQVPDFRVLKNVDISFEKDFVPNIFPLGSQNGGGKSTLLQLIFVLLHCSGDSEKHEFIKNMLYGFEIDDSGKGVLAAIDIWDGEKTVNLEFSVYRDSYAQELLIPSEKLLNHNGNDIQIQDSHENIIFSAPKKLTDISRKIGIIEFQIRELSQYLTILQGVRNIENAEERENQLIRISKNIRFRNIFSVIGNISLKEIKAIDDIKQIILEELRVHQLNLKKFLKEREKLEVLSPKILDYLNLNKIFYIFSYSDSISNSQDRVLLCNIHNIQIEKSESFLNMLSNKIFIAAPTTQVFLFLAQDTRKILFKQQNNYQSQVQKSKSKLPGFFTYDFFAVNLLIDIFKSARDKDFKQAIETGDYGNNYQKLVNELNQILLNKKININPDLSGFTFKLDKPGWGDIELYPEDLSHGELKRLSIYAWIKYNIIEDSIVLIDEIENDFHPDWQYQIIKDIAEWAPKNQYIISTHSYELCQAVTPAHVKELEPRLIKQESES